MVVEISVMSAESSRARRGVGERPGEFEVSTTGEGNAGGLVLDPGLLERVKNVLMSADDTIKAGKAEVGLRSADVVAEVCAGLFCQHDGVAETVCLGVQQCVRGRVLL
ncbi:hypothetical protein [Streptomyces sp. NBC_01176]|uniref:hypothetical protein n=1 Tax=Streptomyces sp. NBC_01176 TaxID=2903760 RepID=UPI0038630798|nr:hypothetical protein OG199_01455 [Streptomyces sp. NBC_01176]